MIIDSPSIVAQNRSTRKFIAVGDKAKQMQGKTHGDIKTIRPLKDGVIADFKASEYMIRSFIESIPAIKKTFIWTNLYPKWSFVFLQELQK